MPTTPTSPEPGGRSSLALVTLTGRDRPGLTAALFRGLGELDAAFRSDSVGRDADAAGQPDADIEILDVEQVVIRGQIVLGVLLRSLLAEQTLTDRIRRVAQDTEMRIEVSFGVDAADLTESRRGRHHVILLGRPLRADTVAVIAAAIAALGGNIDSISRLSDHPVTSLELMVSGAKSGPL
ncbi:MAG: hypothetical protein H0T85_04475, partial [Geodermatophilaceae bacterium]|nr:hypothetical protein [Geodermatophilaceae bacterium]